MCICGASRRAFQVRHLWRVGRHKDESKLGTGLKTWQLKRQPKLVCPVPTHLRSGDGIRQCALGELPIQYPDMRLDNLGQAIDEYILHILGVEEAI